MTPSYRRACVTGEPLILGNDRIKLVLFKRLSGWGFGELYNPDGRLMAVLDHFGELAMRDQDIPMRLEAADYRHVCDGDGESYIFDVETTMPAKMLKSTSFAGWVGYPFTETVLSGTVTFSLKNGDDRIGYSVSLTSHANIYARYLRLLWLLCGEASYGTNKTDALLPGVDWPIGTEWSSGCDFFKDPWANRSIPHPYKVTAPVMSVSEGGDVVAVSYNLDAPITRWFNYAEQTAQPVFACPNFIERMNNNLLGIMIPTVRSDGDENKPESAAGMEFHIGQRLSFDAELYVMKGTANDALVSWVKRYGMPKPSPKYTDAEALEKIATAYNTNLWHETGFGYRHRPGDGVYGGLPGCILRYVSEHKDTRLAAELTEKQNSLYPGRGPGKPADADGERRKKVARGEQILSWQKPDGYFCFEPDGRHYAKDDFRVARAFIQPMGLDGDTALYMNTSCALDLLMLGRDTGETRFLDAAYKALDYSLNDIRPEGGDFWETPLHAANLLAAGHAANTYAVAYELSGKTAYREKAVWFLRTLLAFTQLRNPRDVDSLYNTKPCLCSSDWYFANWVRDYVQWEVLQSVTTAASLGVSWAKLDPELDWITYEYGVVTATYRWMADRTDMRWRPHNIPESLDLYLNGEYDSCFSDTFNSVTGNIGGMFIPPSSIASALYAVLDEKRGADGHTENAAD